MSPIKCREKVTNRSHANEIFLRACAQEDQGKLSSAFRLYLAGAKLGDTGCQVNLGNFYADGRGIKPNREAAVKWYKKAYARGERSAASNLGAMFRDEGKFEKAVSWYERAVKLHDVDANLEIAKILLRNPKDRARAKAFLEQMQAFSEDDLTRSARKQGRQLLKRIRDKEAR